MIDFDTNTGSKHLNELPKVRQRVLATDTALQNATCIDPDCGKSYATIAFEPDPVAKLSPYVKVACCDYFKAKINKKVGSRRHLD